MDELTGAHDVTTKFLYSDTSSSNFLSFLPMFSDGKYRVCVCVRNLRQNVSVNQCDGSDNNNNVSAGHILHMDLIKILVDDK